jgi:hypothetical protein
MTSPQTGKSIRSLIRTYLRNRGEFYRVLLPRIPDAGQRTAFEEATCPTEAVGTLVAALERLPEANSEPEFLSALGLRDSLKKNGFGFAFGRTAISTTEALQRAQFMEETGIVIFERLLAEYPSFAEVFQAELSRRRAALAAMLKLEDSLRYHRLLPSRD